jgi:hypothetical protein
MADAAGQLGWAGLGWRGLAHEGRLVAVEAHRHLVVAEEVAEVDVQQVPALGQHHVVVVAVRYTQHVCRGACTY